MRFVVDILHPIDAHIFHYFIVRMSEKGHEFLITSRQKECATDLLDAWGMEHHILSSRGRGIAGKVLELGVRTAKFLALARPFDPDYLLSEAGPGVAAAALSCGPAPSFCTITNSYDFLIAPLHGSATPTLYPAGLPTKSEKPKSSTKGTSSSLICIQTCSHPISRSFAATGWSAANPFSWCVS